MPSITMLSARFRIRTRVMAGFAAVLALLLVIAATGYLGLAGSRAGFEGYAGVAKVTTEELRIESRFAQMRQQVAVFAATGAPEARTQVAALHAAIRQAGNTATRFSPRSSSASPCARCLPISIATMPILTVSCSAGRSVTPWSATA